MTVWQKIDRERAAALESWDRDIQLWLSSLDLKDEPQSLAVRRQRPRILIQIATSPPASSR